MNESVKPETDDVQLWCEEYLKNQTTEMVNETWGIHPNPTIWVEMDYIAGLKLFAYVVILTGGSLGNMSVILTVLLNKSMRNTTNYYVANLAVSDALICIFCAVPEAMNSITQDNMFLLGKFMCSLTPFTQTACLVSSSLTLTAISCDRSVAILQPFRSRVTKQRYSLVIALIWIISFVIAVPDFITKKYVVYKFENFEVPQCYNQWSETYQYYSWSEEKCHPYHTSMIVYATVAILFVCFLPMLIMGTAYSLILWRLWKTKVPGEQIAANVDAHNRAKRKVNKMVFVVLVVFIICWTPQEFFLFYLFALDSTVDARYPEWLSEFSWFSGFLAFSNSFLNPFIYGGFNRTFLKGFCNILHCGSLRKTKGVSDCSRITLTTTSVPTKSTSKMFEQKSPKSVEMTLL